MSLEDITLSAVLTYRKGAIVHNLTTAVTRIKSIQLARNAVLFREYGPCKKAAFAIACAIVESRMRSVTARNGLREIVQCSAFYGCKALNGCTSQLAGSQRKANVSICGNKPPACRVSMPSM